MDDSAIELSVIIPYFQREKGILRRAIVSALRQEGFDAFDIVVVDDGSPVPAIDDIGDLVAAHPGRIKIIKQQNKRAGAARNTGLNSLPANRRYVALLDSDDEWEPHHLATAVAVLKHGCDCYFSNLYNLDEAISKFDKEEKTSWPGRLRPEEMRAIEGMPQCFEFCGDMFDRALFSGNLIMPTTFVYDFSKFGKVRFREEFRHWGEDVLFFADFAAAHAKFGFSSRSGARRGHGVNSFDKSGWGTPGFLSRLCDDRAILEYAGQAWGLSVRQRSVLREKVAQIRRDFAAVLSAHLVRGEFAQLRQFVRFSRLDPLFPALFPFLVLRSGWNRLARALA